MRKRLVPFLISDGKSSSTANENTFDLIDEKIARSILDNAAANKDWTSNSSRALRGYKVFKNIGGDFGAYQHEMAIGEVIHTNKEGTMGLAMMNLEALVSTKGDFAVLNIPREEEEDAGNKTSTTMSKSDEIVRFIGTFKPSWFQGLDDKTNIKIA